LTAGGQKLQSYNNNSSSFNSRDNLGEPVSEKAHTRCLSLWYYVVSLINLLLQSITSSLYNFEPESFSATSLQFFFALPIGSRPNDHYFCSVCWFVCLSVCLFVCLFVQSFSQPSLIRFRPN